MFDAGDELIAKVARELRREPVANEAAKARILEAVEHESPSGRLAAAWRWLTSPRTLRVSPLSGLATAAGVAALAALAVGLARESSSRPASGAVAPAIAASAATAPEARSPAVRSALIPPTSPAEPRTRDASAAKDSREESTRVVQFVLVAPSASRVSLVGDFNGWDDRATPLSEASSRGVWAVEVPLEPGRHAYAFVVNDSAWVADPAAARAPGDDFGSPSSVIVVGMVHGDDDGEGAT
ncbi:MAG TPA: isoamylase early set domain-containing protein [Gemmatimonadaceae bacterium]